MAIFLSIAVLAFLCVVDPYATGRMTFVDHPVSFDTTPSKASVSRIRNTRFDAAIIGNSTLQTLDPVRLNAATGRTFSQITVPGSGPKEQAAMLKYIARTRGAGMSPLVIGIDLTWCNPQAVDTTLNPFPFWLYEEGLGTYLRGLFSTDNIEAVPRRLRILLGLDAPKRLDGYWNYELHVPARPYPFPISRAVQSVSAPHSASRVLGEALAAFPDTVQAILVLAPMHLPVGGGGFDALTGAAKCKAEIAGVASKRPNVSIIDRWQASPLNQNRDLFLDAVHFREPVARDLEQAIADVMRIPK